MRAGRFDSLFADAAPRPFWWDANAAPEPCPPVAGDVVCDLAIVGGGFTGLWAALIAKERDPGREIVVLEAEHVAFGASGRNGGFAEHSLTHGLRNGLARFSEDELRELERVGAEKFAAIGATLARHGIDARFEAQRRALDRDRAHQVAEIDEEVELIRRFGGDAELLDAAATRAEVDSPLVARRRLASRLRWRPRSGGARLRAAARGARLGVRICERSPVSALRTRAPASCWSARAGACARAVRCSARAPTRRSCARCAAASLPVYDYVLVTEPLSAAQRAAIGWANRQGLDRRRQPVPLLPPDRRRSHPLRAATTRSTTAATASARARRSATTTFGMLAEHFFATFPQLEGIRFTHRWGGAIDTCSRFCAFYGTAHGGRVAYAVGYTGLGVGATPVRRRRSRSICSTAAASSSCGSRSCVPPRPVPARAAAPAGVELTRCELAAPTATGPARPLAARARPPRPRLRLVTSRRDSAAA